MDEIYGLCVSDDTYAVMCPECGALIRKPKNKVQVKHTVDGNFIICDCGNCGRPLEVKIY